MFVNSMLSGHTLVSRLIDFVDRLRQNHRQVISSHSSDIFQQEIHQIEKVLADTRPSRIVRTATLSEPITEQQKIMDLAG